MKRVFRLLACTAALAACSGDASDDSNTSAAGSGGVGGSSGANAGQMSGGAGGVGGAGSGGASAGGAMSTAGAGGVTGGGDGGSAGSAGVAGIDGGDAGGADAGDAGDAGNMEPMPVCPEGMEYPEPEAGEVTEDVCGDFDFAYPYNEGPTWIASEGAFFFTNFERGEAESGDIIKYTPGAGCEKFIEGVGCNGLAVANDGNLLGACHQTRSIEKFDVATKMATTVADMFMDELLDSPNDLVQHDNGGIYFTNPTYELGERDEGVGTAIFWLDRNGVLSRLEPTGNPNGIALTPDSSMLFVVGSGRWDIATDGTPSNHQTANLSGDGVAMDCAGNLYTSGGGIRDADGNNLGNFPGGTNMAFGGADGMTLLVVHGYAPTSARTVRMNIPGLP
jgi:gluconolactonase